MIWADWAISVQNQVRFILFFSISISLSYFKSKSHHVLLLNFKFMHKRKKTPHDAQFPPSIYLVILFIFILFKLGFQHDVHAPHYFNILLFECVVELKVNSEIPPLF